MITIPHNLSSDIFGNGWSFFQSFTYSTQLPFDNIQHILTKCQRSINGGFVLPPVLAVLSLHQELIHLLEFHVLHPFGLVLPLHFFELLGLGQHLLVEVQKRPFEESILLLLGQIEWIFALQFFLLEDVVAMALLLIQDLEGQGSIVVQFLK